MKTIFHLLNHEHERLDELFFRFRELMEIDPARARKAFREFDSGLREHIRFEEQTLFRLYDERLALNNEGPTEVMRLEHRIIRQLLAELDRKLESAAASDGASEQIVLREFLQSHNNREESAIYLTLDKLSRRSPKVKRRTACSQSVPSK